MTSLNIDKYNENNESAVIWKDAGSEDDGMAVTNDSRPVEALQDKPDLFELARSISYRANFRRRFKRSSSII